MIEVDQLIAHALGEHPDPDRIDEHLLGCSHCAHTFERILLLGDGVRELVGTGKVRFAVSADMFERLEAAGLLRRFYKVEPGGSVACSVGATDVYVAAVLLADLAGVTRLDVIQHSHLGVFRIVDVPFDPAGVVRTVELGDYLRTLTNEKLVFELVAVEGGSDRSLGKYYFNHTSSAPR